MTVSAYRIGQVYTAVVMFYLVGEDVSYEGETEELLVSRFNKQVVAELAKCSA